MDLSNLFHSENVIRLAVTAAVMLGILLLARFARGAVGRYVSDTDVRYTARKAIAFVAAALCVVVAVASFSRQLTGLTVAFGVAGAGIAFALQEVIASVAGWMALLAGGFYNTGDRIQLGGIRGDVIDIGILRTTLMECGQWVDGDLYNGRIVRVANSFVFKEPVVNYSADFPFLWDEIRIPVGHGSDRALARSIFIRVVTETSREVVDSGRQTWAKLVRRYRIEDARLEPLVTLAADENWLTYTIRYVVDYRRRRIARDELFTRILDEIEATGGAVALATTSMQLLESGPLAVTVTPAVRPGPS